MPSQYIIGSSTLTDIADAIRLKGGTSSPMAPTEMPNLIDAIPSGGSDIPPHAYESSTISSFSSNATYILDNAFAYCSNLTSVDFPQASHIGRSVFWKCTSLTTVSFPQASYIGNSAFTFCSNLITASFPQANYIESYAFYSCNKLTTASFPQASYIGSSAFAYCIYLTTASFSQASDICSSVFRNCCRLISLYLLGSSIPTLYASNAFYSTPIGGYSTFAGQYGSIFVPASLFNSYKTATNWATYSSRFVSI